MFHLWTGLQCKRFRRSQAYCSHMLRAISATSSADRKIGERLVGDQVCEGLKGRCLG